MRKDLLIAVFLLCFVRVAFSQNAIPIGARIRAKAGSEVRENGAIVPLKKDEWIAGKFLTNNAEYLTIDTGKNVQKKLVVDTLQQVQQSHGRARMKGVLIGAGVGAAGGLIYGAIASSGCRSRGGWFCGMEYAVTIVTIPAGALIGFLAANERWSDVPLYQFQGTTPRMPRSYQLVLRW